MKGLVSYLSSILFKICSMPAFWFCIMVSNSCCIFAWRSASACRGPIFPLRKSRVSLALLCDFLATGSAFSPAFRLLVYPSFSQAFRLISSPIARLNQPILCWCNQGYWPLPPPIFLISLPSKYPSRYLRCHLHSVWPWICPVAVFFTRNFTEVSPFRRSVMAFHTFPRSTVLALKIQGSEALTSFARIKSCASVHSMIELEEGKQNFIENRFCLWIHLSGKFQNFRDKSEEQNSILYKQVLAM